MLTCNLAPAFLGCFCYATLRKKHPKSPLQVAARYVQMQIKHENLG